MLKTVRMRLGYNNANVQTVIFPRSSVVLRNYIKQFSGIFYQIRYKLSSHEGFITRIYQIIKSK